MRQIVAENYTKTFDLLDAKREVKSQQAVIAKLQSTISDLQSQSTQEVQQQQQQQQQPAYPQHEVTSVVPPPVHLHHEQQQEETQGTKRKASTNGFFLELFGRKKKVKLTEER
ncbi:hypothetical protein HDV00_011915 [Rhizophlyctis rosea]|nr:hypothetical protein HDV00_011915 [Rhizophlyctis rosea]